MARATDCFGYIAQGQQDFRTALSLAEQAVRLQTEPTQLHPQQDQLQIDLAATATIYRCSKSSSAKVSERKKTYGAYWIAVMKRSLDWARQISCR